MKAYDEIWGVAEDNFGVITSAKAEKLGVSRQNMVAMERSGILTRLCHGVYQVKHHVPRENDLYGVGVAMVGENAYLRGASVVGMLNLAPTNPSVIYVGSDTRVRRRLPTGIRVKDRTACRTIEYEGYEGVPCQPLVDALFAAKEEGAIEGDRIAEAALRANEKGLITDDECSKFQG